MGANGLITARQAAEFLGVHPLTLARWRMAGTSPKYIRFGGPKGRVMYLPGDIAEFLAGHSAASTTEEQVNREAKQ
jgi:hypothetical protein